jgi:hypothetical protein
MVRDNVTGGSLAGRIGHRHLIPPQTCQLCLDCDRSNSSGSTALIAHRLASRLLGFGYQGLDGDCSTLCAHGLDLNNPLLNILTCIQSGRITSILSIPGKDVGRIGGFAGGQLLGKPFVPGIAKRGQVNDSPY